MRSKLLTLLGTLAFISSVSTPALAGIHDAKIREIIADQLVIPVSQVRDNSRIYELGGNDRDLEWIVIDIDVEIGTILTDVDTDSTVKEIMAQVEADRGE